MSKTTTHTINTAQTAGVPPAPPEAHQKAGWVQIGQTELDRHHLSGEFFISGDALALLESQGQAPGDVLSWFNAYPESVTTGETRRISATLQAFFGYDGSKPGRRCFFVRIERVSR